MASVAKNTLWMTLASVGQKVVSFAYFTILARLLHVEAIGQYTFALFFTSLFSILTDLGLTPVLTREVAKDKTHAERYLQHILSAKILTTLTAYGIVLFAAHLIGYDAEKIQLIAVAGFVMLFDSIHLTYYGVLRALQDVRWESMGMFGSQALTMVLGLLAVWAKLPLVTLLFAYVVSSVLNVAYSSTVVSRVHGIRFHPVQLTRVFEDRAFLRRMFVMAFPFALAGVFTRVYSSLDTVLLERIAGDKEVAYYAVPYKIAFAFQFIPMALTASLYPKMSEYYQHARERLADIYLQATKYLLLVSLPIVVGVLAIGRELILSLYTSSYDRSVPVLSVMIVSIIFSFLSFPVGSMLNACSRQHVQTMIMGLVMVVDAVLDLVLIPQYGALGAAIAATIGYAVLFFGGLIALRDLVRIPYSALARMFALIALSAACMGVLVIAIRPWTPMVVQVGAGALLYAACLAVFRVMHLKEALTALRR